MRHSPNPQTRIQPSRLCLGGLRLAVGWGIAPRVEVLLSVVAALDWIACFRVYGSAYVSPGCLSPGWRVADVWRRFPALASSLVFLSWHGRQSVCRFSSLFPPPCVIGVMWSISRCVGGAGVPQCWQVWWSRWRMCLRVWVGTCLVLVHMMGWDVLVWGGVGCVGWCVGGVGVAAISCAFARAPMCVLVPVCECLHVSD